MIFFNKNLAFLLLSLYNKLIKFYILRMRFMLCI